MKERCLKMYIEYTKEKLIEHDLKQLNAYINFVKEFHLDEENVFIEKVCNIVINMKEKLEHNDLSDYLSEEKLEELESNGTIFIEEK